jgi:hypothetical protein
MRNLPTGIRKTPQGFLDDRQGYSAAGSSNKRRTDLMDFWTTQGGRHQANPVKATHAYEEPHSEPRAGHRAEALTADAGENDSTRGLACRYPRQFPRPTANPPRRPVQRSADAES